MFFSFALPDKAALAGMKADQVQSILVTPWWKNYFEEKGYEVETKIRGLGECEGIRRMFYQHLKEATELE